MKNLFFILLLSSSYASASKVLIDKKFCDQYVVNYQTPDGVNYNPKEQAFGPPVDVNGSIRIKTPKQFNIPVLLNLNKYLGKPVKNNALGAFYLGDLGDITVNMDGRIYFNGQPLYPEDQYKIEQACKKLEQK